MSAKPMLISVNLLGSIDGITLEVFIIRKLVQKLWKSVCVLIDNYNSWSEKEIGKPIKYGEKLIFLSPYFLEFSPIDPVGSKLKYLLCSQGARNYQILKWAIASAFEQVDEQDFWNWLTHCCYGTAFISERVSTEERLSTDCRSPPPPHIRVQRNTNQSPPKTSPTSCSVNSWRKLSESRNRLAPAGSRSEIRMLAIFQSTPNVHLVEM
jgi:hypothetical protein